MNGTMHVHAHFPDHEGGRSEFHDAPQSMGSCLEAGQAEGGHGAAVCPHISSLAHDARRHPRALFGEGRVRRGKWVRRGGVRGGESKGEGVLRW